MYLSKNLRHLRRKNNRQTQEELADSLGLTRSVISSYEDGRAEPSVNTLIRMSEYFNVSIDSLTNLDLANVDEKQVQHQKEIQKYTSAVNLKINHVMIDQPRVEVVRLVPERAAAGYTSGFGDQDYLEDLPSYQLPFLSKGKTYRAFEITGDSMLPLKDKSIVIGEKMESIQEVRDGQVCIVVSKDGIVLKKVYNKADQRGTLLLKSANIAYSPYEVSTTDILEVWKFSAHISKEFPEEVDDILELKNAFMRMESEIQEMKVNQVKK
jgi:transcriptional regulator with XRE-family HTH domain